MDSGTRPVRYMSQYTRSQNVDVQVLPSFYMYSQPHAHIARMRPKGAGLTTFFSPSEIKMVCGANGSV
jgi:hypothetical protein